MINTEAYHYNSVVMAKYIIAVANSRRITVNITKVQKLLYIAYGVFMAVTEERLTNEHPKAWPYGPVFPTTRNKLVDADLYSISMEDPELQEIKNDAEINSLMDLVLGSFGSWTAGQLTEWSHSDGSPWEKTVCQNEFKWGMPIPDDYIYEYFKTFVYVRQ